MLRTLLLGKTMPCWNSSKLRPAISSPRRRKPASATTFALSIVGCDRLPASGYLRAKVAQEKLIKASPIPYTVVRATQFFEFVGGIAQSATNGQTVRLPSALFQPIFSDEVAAALATIAVAKPLSGTVELAGPDALAFEEVVRQY